MNKGVYYVRSTSIINDSRATKEISSLIKNNYSVTVVGWDRDKRINDYKNVMVNNNLVNSKFFKFSAKYGSSIRTILGLILFQIWLFFILFFNGKNYKYIHACDLDCGFISMIIVKILRKKLIYDMYDYYSDSRLTSNKFKNIIDKIENKVVEGSDASIICGEWRQEQIKSARPKLLYVIHNTPDIKKIDDQKIIRSNTKKIKIGYVGILQEDRLIMEVINELKDNNNYELHIGGFGKLEQTIQDLADKYCNIYFYGSLVYSDVLALERDCDILFATYNPKVTNHRYSAPNKIYEAMALGKPIIVCKETGIDKLVVENKLGFSIDYNSCEFLEIIENIRNKKVDIDEIGRNAKKMYNDKYNWLTMEKILIEIYDNLER